MISELWILSIFNKFPTTYRRKTKDGHHEVLWMGGKGWETLETMTPADLADIWDAMLSLDHLCEKAWKDPNIVETYEPGESTDSKKEEAQPTVTELELFTALDVMIGVYCDLLSHPNYHHSKSISERVEMASSVRARYKKEEIQEQKDVQNHPTQGV